jgi:hypothetical protein
MIKRGVIIALLLIILLNNYTNADTNATLDNETNISSGDNTNISLINETSENNSLDNNQIVDMLNFFPKEFGLGDAQINIQIQNKKNESVDSITAFISGDGFSTYNVIPTNILGPNEKDYIFVNGNFKKSGNISLTIEIKGEVFYQNISIIDTGKTENETNEQEKNKSLILLSREVGELKNNYSDLESELSQKKNKNYDVSGINLDELKRLIRSAESDVLSENSDGAKVNLKLAEDEYNYQKEKLDNSKEIPAINRLKDYAVVFSAIFGCILTFFLLSEHLKKRGEGIAGSLGNSVKALKEKRKKLEESKKTKKEEPKTEEKKETKEKEISKEEEKK